MSILSVLNIGALAMGAQQQAVQTAGHNLANVDTPGFARQRVNLATAVPVNTGPFFLGQGVHAESITGVVDNFLEAQLVTLNGNLGSAEAEHRALVQVADAFPTSEGSAIGPALDAFFGALSELANNPAGQAERVNLLGRARALGDTLRHTRETLTTVQADLDLALAATVRRVNVLLPQIAALNGQITTGESSGARANDFRDQRQRLLQELSHLTGATVFEQSDGQVNVQVDGVLLVSGTQAASLDDSSLNPSGLRVVTYKSPAGTRFDATALLTKGEIGSLILTRDTTIPGFLGTLDQFAKTLVDVVNAQHALGFDLNGTAGGDFFMPIAAVAGAAGLVAVDSAIVADPRRIAAAQTAAGAPGDNRNALALVNLQTTTQAALGNLSLGDYFRALVGNVGQQVQSSQDAFTFQQSLLTQTQARRESLSGVNIDEEMTNLIKFQRAFEAASRLIQVGDEMYQSVIEMVR
ncbi:MAG: flagellar hook-associated protein FlgK [Deltaproteobacteria bacterium]|nr:flagellar hook-associated protein FlgK [Deltaproteobacteria bacterium]